MIKSPIHIFDNIGANCSIDNNSFIIGQNLTGYKTLSSEHVGHYVSYLIKSGDLWEVGLGLVKYENTKIIVERTRTTRSSNNDTQVVFSGSINQFYVFANEYNFNVGLNNCVSLNEDTDIENIRATYLVDLSDKNIQVNLPPATENQGLVLEFKGLGSKYLQVKSNNNTICILSDQQYIKLISNGESWISLVSNSQNDSVSSQAAITGISADIAYNALLENISGLISGSNLYLGNNGKLLIGASGEADAASIIPTSGNYPIVFNNTRVGSDFWVKGSGDKSLYFSYTGKLGINVPITVSPDSLSTLHVVNTLCGEGIRLENRNQCSPANMTLYHKPSTLPANNDIVSTINLSSKNSTNNQVDYAQIRSRALNSTSPATSGEFSIAVNSTNNNLLEIFKANRDGCYVSGVVSASSFKLSVPTTSGNLLMSDSSGNIMLTSVANSPIINLIDGGVVVFTGVLT